MSHSWLHVQVRAAPPEIREPEGATLDPAASHRGPTVEQGWLESVKESFKEPEDHPPALAQVLTKRLVQFLAIGGSIGSGLFVSTAGALALGGPGFLLLGYVLVGVSIFFTCQSLAELVCIYPVKGAFSVYSTRFIGPAWGFAMGWNYSLQWLIVLPLEISASGLTVGYWDTHTSPAVYIAVFWVFVVFLNLLGVRGTWISRTLSGILVASSL